MATETIRNEGVRHESRDANIPALAAFGGAIVVTVAIVMLFSMWLFGVLTRVYTAGPAATPFAFSRPMPPEPRLQPKPEVDLQRYLDEEKNELDTYGWIDRPTGVVRIPIERAMQLLLQQGLPVRASTNSQSANANHAAPRGLVNATQRAAKTKSIHHAAPVESSGLAPQSPFRRRQ